MVAGKLAAQTCSQAAAAQQTWQILTLPAPNAVTPYYDDSYYLLQNVASKQCVVAIDHEEAGRVTMGACNASADRSWRPMCDGPGGSSTNTTAEVVPGWVCISRARQPTPHPHPHVRA